jgi:hypothetical protein
MDIRILHQFLSSLRTPFETLGAGRDLEPLLAALGPYVEWDAATFVDFLQAADGFRRNGQVQVPTPDDAALARLAKAAAALRDGVKGVSEGAVQEAQEHAIDVLAEFGKGLGINLSAKVDRNWLKQQRTAAAVRDAAAKLRSLASRIVGPESYSAPEIQSAVDELTTLSTAELKSVDAALGIASAGKGRARIEAALGALSGHARPTSGKKARNASPQASPEEIAAFAARLKERMERSKDREAFPRSEIDLQVQEFEPLAPEAIRAILRSVDLGATDRDSKSAMLKKVREHLDAGHRAFERIEA